MNIPPSHSPPVQFSPLQRGKLKDKPSLILSEQTFDNVSFRVVHFLPPEFSQPRREFQMSIDNQEWETVTATKAQKIFKNHKEILLYLRNVA